MNQEDLKKRTKRFALNVLALIDLLPNSIKGRAIGNQLVRCGTSVGANYRAVCRSRSKAEFVARLGTVIEEADESCFWLELLEESGILGKSKLSELQSESSQLVAIMTKSRKTAGSCCNRQSEI
jgi:four helix bundle protein